MAQSPCLMATVRPEVNHCPPGSSVVLSKDPSSVLSESHGRPASEKERGGLRKESAREGVKRNGGNLFQSLTHPSIVLGFKSKHLPKDMHMVQQLPYGYGVFEALSPDSPIHRPHDQVVIADQGRGALREEES